MAAVVLAIAAAALLPATELPHRLSAAVGGGAAALAELAARSPGARIGGVALKAKAPRAALAPVAGPGPAPGSGHSPVMGAGPGPEGPVPIAGPVGIPGGSIVLPPIPGVPAPGATTPGAAPGPDFAGALFPPIGGLPIFYPGGPGGGGGGPGAPGGGGGGGPGGPGGGIVVPPTPPPVAGPIPEPSTWLMLIAGFGAIGGAMRRGRRVRFS